MPERIRVATTREEFNACFASGEPFEASGELAAPDGVLPRRRERCERGRVFRAGRSGRAGGGLDEPEKRLH